MNIRKKLIILMFIVGLIPVLIVGAAVYVTIRSELISKKVDELVSIANKQEQKISSQLLVKQEETIKITNRFDLQTTLERYRLSNGRDGRQDIHDILLNRKIETPGIGALYVSDLSGVIVASTISDDAGKKLAPQDYSIEPDQGSAITLKKDFKDGINKLYITSKISINKTEPGFLTAIFRIDDIVAVVKDYTGLGSTGETVVAAEDKNHTAISLFPLRFDNDAALRKDLNSIRLFADKKDMPYDTLSDYRGQQVMVVPKSVGLANWVVATKIDKNEVLAPIAQLRSALIAIVIVSSATLILFAAYSSRFFSRPILRIADISKRIGKGDFSARTDEKRRDEIGTLADSINTMGVSLKEFVTDLESQRKRLETVLNSTEESILAIDRRGVIIIANQATTLLTKKPLGEIIGKRLNDLFAWQRNMQQFSVNYDMPGTHSYSDVYYTDGEGITHYVKLIVARISTDQGEMTQTIITIHDETKRQELENMKVDFVSMAAHELRTPLATIRGYLELITYKIGKSAPSEVMNYLNKSLRSTTELGGLIANLLDVTRIERGGLVFNFEKVDIAVELQQAIHDVSFNAKDKNISLIYDGASQGCLVIADQIALHEVINNILTNAIKYTKLNDRVSVSLLRQGDHYSVSIKDTGIGIPKQALPNLFTKFYRVHAGLNSGSTGTGLGLFIAKSIIERHHGTISVVSEEGVGSTFTFTIPVLDEARLMALQTAQQPQLTGTRRKRGWVTQNIVR